MKAYQENSSPARNGDQHSGIPAGEAAKPAIPALQKKEDVDELQAQFIPPQAKEKSLQDNPAQPQGPFKPIQRKKNDTGLPDNLKAGVEKLSGTDLSDVNVHYGSSQPAQFNAHAYAQGTEIHIAPGQEQHLPHEAWHVAQQKQGRVQATTQMKGTGVNDDASLEKEADDMGSRAMHMPADDMASGYERFNQADISDIKAEAPTTGNIGNMQRKYAPIQFGAKSTKPKGEEAKTELYPAIPPADLFAQLQHIRRLGEPERCEALMGIYIDSNIDIVDAKEEKKDDRVTHSAFEGSGTGTGNLRGMIRMYPCTSRENINRNYLQLIDCGGTQSMLIRRFLGDTEGHPASLDFSAERGTGHPSLISRRPKVNGMLGTSHACTLGEAQPMVAQLLARMLVGPCIVPMSAIGGPGHAFTLAYDGNVFYLFQAWVGIHSLLDERYTRTMSGPEAEAYLTGIITAKRGGEERVVATDDQLGALGEMDAKRAISGTPAPGYFAAATDAFCFRYEVHYLNPGAAAAALSGERKTGPTGGGSGGSAAGPPGPAAPPGGGVGGAAAAH